MKLSRPLSCPVTGERTNIFWFLVKSVKWKVICRQDNIKRAGGKVGGGHGWPAIFRWSFLFARTRNYKFYRNRDKTYDHFWFSSLIMYDALVIIIRDMLWRVMTCYDVLWRVITCYDVLWRVMTCYDVLWHVMTCYDMLWYVMTCYDMLWHVMTCYDMSWRVMPCYDMLWHVKTCYDVLWHVMPCYDTL